MMTMRGGVNLLQVVMISLHLYRMGASIHLTRRNTDRSTLQELPPSSKNGLAKDVHALNASKRLPPRNG